MARPARVPRLDLLQRAGAVALGLSAAAALGYACSRSPGVVFLWPGGFAPWITDPRPVDARVQQWGSEEVPVARFVRGFELDAAPARAELVVQGVRALRLRVNGQRVLDASGPEADWRMPQVLDVAPWLRAGPNRLEVEVWNARGPPLLRVRLALGGRTITTGTGWSVSTNGGASRDAVAPDDTRLHPSAPAGPSPLRALGSRWSLIAGLLVAAALLWAGPGGRIGRQSGWAPALALAAIHAAWIGLLLGRWVEAPLTLGFDARHHLAYVELMQREWRVPLAQEGWSTYHPPLFYALAAALRESLGSAGAFWDRLAARLVPFAGGLGIVWVAYGLAQVLAPGRPALVATAVLFAGLLPLDLYSAAYLSNEPLHAALFGAAMLLAVRALLRPRLRLVDVAGIGAVVGLAMLAKVTALVLAAVTALFLAAAAVGLERVRPARALALAAGFAAPVAAIAGWFYVRNELLYGRLVVGNWNLPGQAWWSQPGFHTFSYYLGFGEVFRRPLLAGFHSFADALYSSFWGDGWIGGRATAAVPPEIWRPDLAAIGYLLAVPLTLVLGVGFLRSARLALGPGEARLRVAWSFLLTLQLSMVFAMLWLTLELPYFGQAKAGYLLGLAPVLALTFAIGADAADATLERWAGRGAAVALRTLLTAAGALFLLSFAA
jgi:hypothetical protein